MKIFSDQIDLTAYWEQGPKGGPALVAYRCPAGVWTLGYGETMPNGKPVTQNMVCTEMEARNWLEGRLNGLQAWAYVEWEPEVQYLNYYRLAIADYAYNCGKNAFPTLLKKLKAGDIEGAILEFLDGVYVAKKPLLGLLLRRISEYNTFTTGQYVAFEKGDSISQDLKNKLLAKNANNVDAVNMINQLGVK